MSQASMVRPTELVAEFFARGPSREEIAAFRLPDATITYIRELLHKNSAGTLTPAETQELDELVLLDRIVNLIRSRVPLTRDDA
jgi:hypothetical protein